MRGVGFVKAGQVAGKGVNVGGRVFAHQALVQGLERKFAGAAAVVFAAGLAGAGGGQAHAGLAGRALGGCGGVGRP